MLSKFMAYSLFLVVFFLLVHSFYIFSGVNSSLFVPFVLILGLLPFLVFRITVFFGVINAKVVGMLLVLVIMGIISLVPAVAHGTADYTYTKNFFSHFIQLLIVLFFLIVVLSNKLFGIKSISDIQRALVLVFVIQSCVQIAAFLFPSFAALVHTFYEPKVVELLYSNYDGGRGLALTGAPGWGLSVGYGLAFIFYVKEYLIEDSRYGINTFLIGVLILSGMLFAGRSAFLGVILGGLYYMVYLDSRRTVFLLKSVIYICCIAITIGVLFPKSIDRVQDVVVPFVFEAYIMYLDTGTIQTVSTNKLIEMWRVPVNYDEFLLGTGNMLSETGSGYFRNTDVGYLRNVLYGGFFWTAVLYFYFLYIGGFLRSWMLRDLDSVFYLFVFIYIFILEAKAMTVGYNKYLFTMIMVFCVSKIYFSMRNVGEERN